MVVPICEIFALINIESQTFKRYSKEKPLVTILIITEIFVYGDIHSPFTDPILHAKSIFPRGLRKLSSF